MSECGVCACVRPLSASSHLDDGTRRPGTPLDGKECMTRQGLVDAVLQ